MKDIDLEKISGRYLHYGHIFLDIVESGFSIFDDFYNEVWRVQDAVLTEIYENSEEFDRMKKKFIQYLALLIKIVDDTSQEEVKERLDKFRVEGHWKDLKRFFSKVDLNYFR